MSESLNIAVLHLHTEMRQERAVDKVEILPVCTHTWVGMKAGKHRVAVALSLNVQRRYNSDRDYE